MQPLRSSVGQVSRQLNRNMNSLFPQNFSHSNTGAMSLFPGFGSELGPFWRLFDQHSRQVFPGFDRQLNQLRSFSPKFDVKETNEGYELHGELPGVQQKDINIEWTDANTLTISGRHEHVREEGQRPQTLEEGNKTQALEEGANKMQATVTDAPEESSANTETQAATQSEASNAETTPQQEQKQQPQQEQQKQPTSQDKYWVSERSVGEFQRSFSFPTRVEQDAVTASLKNGILSIVIPRSAAPPTKKIAIQ